MAPSPHVRSLSLRARIPARNSTRRASFIASARKLAGPIAATLFEPRKPPRDAPISTPAARESTACGKSSSPGDSRFPRGEGRPQRGRSEGSLTGNALCPPAAPGNHTGASAVGVLRVSCDDYEFLACVRRQRAQRLLAPVLEDRRNRLTQVGKALFTRLPLAVGSRNLRAVGDVLWAVRLDNRRELVAHDSIQPPPECPEHAAAPMVI